MGSYLVEVGPSHDEVGANVPLVAEEHLLACHDPDLSARVQSVQFMLGLGA